MTADNVLLPPCVEQKARIALIPQTFKQQQQKKQNIVQKISKDKNLQEDVCEYVNKYVIFYKWFKSSQGEEN